MTPVVAGGDGPGNVRGTVVCDLDGVVYLDQEGIPGAGAALSALRDAGFGLLFATNNSTKTARQVAAKIEDRTGFEVSPAAVLTSGLAAVHLLGGTAERALVMGGPGLAETLVESGITVVAAWEEAQAVVVGLDLELSYARLHDASRAIRAGARFVATNGDVTFPTPSGPAPGGGAMVAALEAASGVTAEIAGKPHAAMRELVRERVGAGPVWVIGDRPETDLALAGAEGWRRVLVLSGITTDPASVPDEFTPDLVVASIVDFAAAVV